MPSLKLSDLVDLKRLQRMADNLYAAGGIPVGIIDLEDNILVGAGWQDICTKYHRVHPVAVKNCHISDRYIKEHMNNGSAVAYKCISHMWDIAVPLVVRDEHIATLFVGQFFYDDEQIDYDLFRRQAAEYGFEETSYIEALKRVPVFSRQRVSEMIEYYIDLVNTLVENSLSQIELRQVNSKLQASQARFLSLFNDMSEGVALHDLLLDDTGKPINYCITDVNSQYEKSLNIRKEDIINRPAAEVYGTTEPPYLEEYSRVVLSETPYRFETYFPPLKKYFLISVSPLGKNQFATIFFDITEQKKTEEELKVALEKYRVLFDSFPLAITISDAKGNIIESNRVAERLLGISFEEQKKRKIFGKQWNIIRLDGTPMPAKEFASVRALKEKRVVEDVEMGVVMENGQVSWISVTAAPLPLEGYGVAIAYSDISERVEARAILQRINEELERRVAERTAELAESNRYLADFSYSISHDLRTPLRSMDGFSQILLEDHGEKLDNEGKEYLQRIRFASQRMGRLIDDLLRLTHISLSEMEVQNVDLGAIASEMVSRLSEDNPERKVEYRLKGKLIARADPGLIRIVLGHLLDNAWKFSAPKMQTFIEVGVTNQGEKKVFYVKDNGIGFNMAYAGKLFEPFQRLHGLEINGDGIGLALAQRIINRHGGSIWAEGIEGEGAIFYFTLPE